MIPEDLRYVESHEYVHVEDDIATIGITEYAVEQLGDVVFVELPEIDAIYDKGDVFGTIESVKTVSELYIPLSGKILEVNETLREDPSLINTDCYGDGWIIRIEIKDPKEIEQTLTFSQYEEFLKTL